MSTSYNDVFAIIVAVIQYMPIGSIMLIFILIAVSFIAGYWVGRDVS
ncbi:hypothetical protein SBV1_gp15 [Sulfolobales Beppu virus 1]|nr:hypothetical protein SBV1_gp15 [Sulfolobales Beppu virus 1]